MNITMQELSRNSNLNDRQQEILEFARLQGRVLVDSLAETLSVTPQTIRRDLTELCRLRLLQRVHGGAIATDGIENLGYEARKQMATESKQAIGKCAAELIPNDSSLFINIGTTTEQVAEHLLDHLGLLVITNNMNVVNTMWRSETIDVMTAGGIVRREDGGIVGESATQFIDQFKLDFAVIGVSAIEEDGAILDFDTREVSVTQAIIRNSRSVILVADEIKFSRKASVRVCNIADIDHFVTDYEPPAKFMQICKNNDVSVKIATP
jgi:DeoR family glycerol-3-phosphate regulon repressor